MWLARSSFSTSSTPSPRPAASRAIAAPLMPPPTTRRSKESMAPLIVIASEASNPVQCRRSSDCFVATLLAMTGEGDAAMADDHPRHRCGHDEHAGDAVRGGRGVPRGRAEGTGPALSAAGVGRARRRGDLGESPRLRAGDGRQAGGARADRRDRHHQPARDDRLLVAADGAPLGAAIVWQDRRTADLCAALKEQGEEAALQAKTGLLLDPYFSAARSPGRWRTWPRSRRPARISASARWKAGWCSSSPGASTSATRPTPRAPP